MKFAVLILMVAGMAGCGVKHIPPPHLTTVTVSWNPQPDAQNFRIYRGGQFVGASNSQTFLDPKPVQHSTNVYTVTAVGEGGESKPSAGSVAIVP